MIISRCAYPKKRRWRQNDHFCRVSPCKRQRYKSWPSLELQILLLPAYNFTQEKGHSACSKCNSRLSLGSEDLATQTHVMNNFVLLAGAGDFSIQHQFLPSIGSSANACKQEPGVICLPTEGVQRVCRTLPSPSRMKFGLGKWYGGEAGRNNLPPCEICWKGIPGSHLTRDLSLPLGGLPQGKQRLIATFHALCISSPPRLPLLNHCKIGMLWGRIKMSQLWSWELCASSWNTLKDAISCYLAFLLPFFFFKFIS